MAFDGVAPRPPLTWATIAGHAVAIAFAHRPDGQGTPDGIPPAGSALDHAPAPPVPLVPAYPRSPALLRWKVAPADRSHPPLLGGCRLQHYPYYPELPLLKVAPAAPLAPVPDAKVATPRGASHCQWHSA